MEGCPAATEGLWQVVLRPSSADLDARGRDVLGDVHALGLTGVGRVQSSVLYLLAGPLDPAWVERIAAELLADPVTQQYACASGISERADEGPAVEVHYRPGVMDPVAMSTRQAINELLRGSGAPERMRVREVRTARRYVFDGVADRSMLERIARQVLANDCIETAYLTGFGQADPLPATFPEAPERRFELRTVSLSHLDAAGLAELSRRAHLFLSVEELEGLREHYRRLKRDPTDLELETLAQTWSEHCAHKTLKSAVTYRGPGFQTDEPVEVHYENLLADTIAKVTRDLNRDWCLSVFEDNAGVIEFDKEFGLAVKVETHNHPSAIEPYGGAATGIGGCIRDIMGCGLGAKPIASTDVFCLAPPDFPAEKVPAGVLHPRRVLKGVVAGVRDYGNRMGIPTVNGAIHFDERYLANPLVFCGCLGLISRDRIAKAPRVDDLIVLVGGRTGRDGIHGATFSSAELTDTHADEFSHAVQIGNPITEKKMLDALLRARDHESGPLYSAITDCGAGGLSSAVGEMARQLGAIVELEQVPLKYTGLRYDEIWISEAQERMVLAVPPDRLTALRDILAEEDVESAIIGRFTGDGQLKVCYGKKVVGSLDVRFLHEGRPRRRLTAEWHQKTTAAREPLVRESLLAPTRVLQERLLRTLASPTVASKEWVIRQYDHEVQGGSTVKPLCGPGDGPSDAAVLRPRLDSHRGVALACGLAPQLSDVDEYAMAVAAVDEALRNVVCVGGDPDRTAILDNFCWGSVDQPESLGGLVRACQGAHDAALAYRLPFISGKDSLNNRFAVGDSEAARTGLPERLSVPGTLLITAVSILPDVGRCVTMDLKTPVNRLVMLRCSEDHRNLAEARAVHSCAAEAIRSGRVRAAHDLSDGGLAVTLAEMCIASGLGAEIALDALLDGGELEGMLWTAPLAGYCLEIEPGASIPDGGIVLGCITLDPRLILTLNGHAAVEVEVAALREAWQGMLPAGPGRHAPPL